MERTIAVKERQSCVLYDGTMLVVCLDLCITSKQSGRTNLILNDSVV
jgi:hypothetical protein